MNNKGYIIIIGIGILIGVLCFIFVFFSAFGGLNFLIPVPRPTVTYGEFPFRLEYEVNGNTKVIEDIIICEFDGFEVWGESGKYRKWKTYLKSGTDKSCSGRITLLNMRNLNEKDDFGNTILEFFFSYGNAEYLMGEEWHKSKAEIHSYIEFLYQNEDGMVCGSSYNADIAYERFKIRLISWECAPPIENKFQ